MKNVIIVHGKPSKEVYYSGEFSSSSNFAWIPWVQKQLIIRDIKADAPEMPHSYNPDYGVWKTEFERFDVTPQTTLVGHSCGAGFLVRWVSEHPEVQVGKVILVAPSLDPTKKITTGFSDFEIDSAMLTHVGEVIVFTSDNDSENAETSVKMLTDTIEGIEVKMFPGYGHFIPEHMNQEIFPELVEEILK
jgi:predicted alpha/beta hydrolase family esterase